MGSIRHLSDKKYRIVYDVPRIGGKRKQKTETLSGVTRREAERIYAERVKSVSESQQGRSEYKTMNEFFDHFLQSRVLQGCAPTTVQRYTSLLKVYLRPSFGEMKPGDIKAHHIVEAHASWSCRKSSATTRLHAHGLLRAVLNRAVMLDVISVNPTSKIGSEDLPKAKKPESRVLTELELSRLLEEAENPSSRSKKRGYLSSYSSFFPAVVFAAYTGARRGEVLALRWSDVNLQFGTVKIARSLTQTRAGLLFKEPKNGRTRDVSISKSLVTILRTHQAMRAKEKLALGPAYRDEDLVFCKPDGSKLTPWNFGAAFEDLVKRSGVPRITLHDLRDTHASLLAKKGVPIQVISARLGHSSIGVTYDRYITMYRDQDDAAARAFEELVG